MASFRIAQAFVQVDADTSKAEHSVDRLMARLAGLGPVNVPVNVDTGAARAQVASLDKQARSAGDGFGGFAKQVAATAGGIGLFKAVSGAIKWPVMIEKMRVATAGAGSLGVAFGGLVGSLGPLVGLVPAAAVGMSSLGQGLGVVKIATAGLGDALKIAFKGGEGSAAKLDEALKGMDPSARRLVETITRLKPQLEGIRNTAQAGLFPGVIDAIKNMEPLLGHVKTVVGATATALGDLARDGGEMARQLGPELEKFGLGNIPILQNLGQAFIDLAPAIVRIATAAQPLVLWLSELVKQASEWTIRASAAAEQSGRLAGFFEQTKSVVQTLGGIVASLGKALFHVGQIGADTGRGLLASLGQAMDGFNNWTQVPENAAMLQRLAVAGGEVARALGTFAANGLQALLRAADQTAPKLAPLIEMAGNKLIPAFEKLVSTIDVAFIERLINLGAVVLELAGTFGTLVPIMGPFLDILTNILGFVADGIDKVPGLGLAIGGLSSAFAAVQFAQLFTGLSRLKSELLGVSTKTSLMRSVFDKMWAGGWTKNVLANAAAMAKLKVITLAQAVASKVAAAAQWLLNLALDANPISLIIIGIAALVAGLVLAYTKIGWFRDFVDAALHFIGGIFTWLIEHVGGFVKEWGVLLLGPIGFVIKFKDEIWGAVQAIGRFLGDLIGRVVDFVREWGVLILGPIGAVIKFRDQIGNAIGNVVEFFVGLPGRIISGIGDLAGRLAEFGRNMIDGLIQAIKNTGSRVADALLGLIPSPLRGALANLFGRSPSPMFEQFGRNWIDGLVRSVDANHRKVSNALSGLLPPDMDTALTVGMRGVGASGAAAPAGRSVTFAPGAIVVHGAPGMDVEQVANMTAARIVRALR